MNQQRSIRLFLTDVDGVLTDAGMYYTEAGDELKKFNTRDGMGLKLLREAGIKTGIITTENTKLVERRAAKLKVDYLVQGAWPKLDAAMEICRKEGIDLSVKEGGSNKREMLILSAEIFPMINLLWLGCLVMVVGTVLAIRHRYKLHRR